MCSSCVPLRSLSIVNSVLLGPVEVIAGHRAVWALQEVRLLNDTLLLPETF